MAATASTSAAPGATPQRPFQTKLVLLGEAAVGKSSVVLRFVSDDFQENKEPTIGAAFLTQKCRLEDKIIKFEIWDTAGQERFHSLAPMYYRNAQASIVVYDVLKAKSYDKAKSWVKELQRQANSDIIIALVGNKIDLLSPEEGANDTPSSADTTAPPATDREEGAEESDDPPVIKRAIPREEAEAYAKEAGLLFFETSAKTGAGVEEVFTEIAKKIPIEEILAQRARHSATSPGAAGQPGRGGSVDLNSTQTQSQGCNC